MSETESGNETEIDVTNAWQATQDQKALLIGLLVVIAVFAMLGSVLWKKSNRHDPATKAEPFKFFVQNQLGAIITVLAFLPLLALIFLDKDMERMCAPD